MRLTGFVLLLRRFRLAFSLTMTTSDGFLLQLYLHCSEDEILLQGSWSVKGLSCYSASDVDDYPTLTGPAARVVAVSVDSPAVAPSTPATPLPPSGAQTPPPLEEPSSPPPLVATPAPVSSSPSAPSAEVKRALFASAADGDDDSSSEEEEIMPSSEYAKLRLKLDAIIGTSAAKGKVRGAKKNSKPKPAMVVPEPEEAKRIRKRMDVVKAMYLFQKDEAGALACPFQS